MVTAGNAHDVGAELAECRIAESILSSGCSRRCVRGGAGSGRIVEYEDGSAGYIPVGSFSQTFRVRSLT